MPRTLPNRRFILAVIIITLLVAAAWAVPSLSQPQPRGYARLLCPQAAATPDAVTDCRMAAIRLRGPCGDGAAIPDDAFDNLRDQCRQAARASAGGRADQRTARI